MSTRLNKKETTEIIQSSNVLDLLILKHNYEELERTVSTSLNKYFLNLVKKQLQKKDIK